MRNDEWLATFFHEVWERNFPDVKKRNNVVIRWKGKWKNKFGHIKRLKNKDTEIGINYYFMDKRVPEFVIELTIAHELVHYLHGFQSPYEKKFRHPHQGGVVNKELKERGYVDLLRKERFWFKNEWQELLKEFGVIKRKSSGSVVVRQLRSSFRFF